MRVLITGAAGFFGKALVRVFARWGHDVVAADRESDSSFEPRPGSGESISYVQIDVSDPASLTTENIGKVDAVVHAAALTPSLEEMEQSPQKLVSVNLVGTLNLLEVARLQSCSKFLFVSSAGVYDQFTETTLGEADADGGFSLYGSAKLAAEIMLWRYGKMYDVDVGAIRPTSMYGPAEEFRPTRPFVTPVKQLVDAALLGTPVQVINGQDRCDWVYVDDVADAAHRFFSAGMVGRVFNLSSGRPARFDEVVAAAEVAAGLKVDPHAEVVIDGAPDRPTVISNERAWAELDFAPRSLEEGIRSYVYELRA